MDQGLPRLNKGLGPLSPSAAPRPSAFCSRRDRAGSQGDWGEGRPEALVCSLKESQKVGGPGRTSVITCIRYFPVPRPLLSALHELVPFIPIGSPGRPYDYSCLADEETEAQRGEVTGSTACKGQSWDCNLGSCPQSPRCSLHQRVSEVGVGWAF